MVGAEITEPVGRRRVDAVTVQEVRYRNEGVKTLRGCDFENRLYWKGEVTANGGVGLMVKREIMKKVMDVRRISSRILFVYLVLIAYEPQSGRSEEDRNSFYDDLIAEMQSKDRNYFLRGDFNGHVRSSIGGYEEHGHGGQKWRIQNKVGERLLEFANGFDVVVGNSFFKKTQKS